MILLTNKTVWFSLYFLFVQKDTKEEGRSFFKDTLPGVARLALQLPHICSKVNVQKLVMLICPKIVCILNTPI